MQLGLENAYVFIMSIHENETPNAHSRLGRPPVLSDAARCAQIVAAAEAVFLSNGFSAATMKEIAKAAGMSKRTLYKYFDTKETLFIAFINEAEVVPDALQLRHSDPREELRQRFLILLRHALSPRQIRMTRLMIEEADTFPTMAKAFYDRAMKRGNRYIAETLSRLAAEQPERDSGSAEQLAAIVTGAVFGELYLRALLCENSSMTETEMSRRIDVALGSVFAGSRPGGDDQPL